MAATTSASLPMLVATLQRHPAACPASQRASLARSPGVPTARDIQHTPTLLAALAFVCLKNSSISCLVACADDMAIPSPAVCFLSRCFERRNKGHRARERGPLRRGALSSEGAPQATALLSLRAASMRNALGHRIATKQQLIVPTTAMSQLAAHLLTAGVTAERRHLTPGSRHSVRSERTHRDYCSPIVQTILPVLCAPSSISVASTILSHGRVCRRPPGRGYASACNIPALSSRSREPRTSCMTRL